jgi:SagB-type dehydrogenase family enzyme
VAASSKRLVKRKRAQPRTPYYRRSPFLVSYWKDKYLLFENYLTGKIVAASAETATLLDCFGKWQTVEAICRRWPKYTAKSVRTSVKQLAKETLLETTNQKNFKGTQQVRALQQWREWIPAAAFFHMSTKDGYAEEITKEDIKYIEGLMVGRATSLVLEQKPHKKLIKLRSGSQTSEFSQVLKQRRTWRKFSAQKVSGDVFGTLLDLSFGVQHWDRVAKLGRLAQKTSPSGGSLHPLEAYVMVRKVEGVSPGIYHYDSIGRGLHQVRRGVSAKQIQKYLAGQWWFRDAAFVVCLTAIFARTQWKYDYARAYRAILIEAGHLCQTFCLTATWLRLAPFCTIAMADTAIEKALKVDGISESVIYAMGAGVKPEEE